MPDQFQHSLRFAIKNCGMKNELSIDSSGYTVLLIESLISEAG